jgi:thymidylate synthase (FAD)
MNQALDELRDKVFPVLDDGFVCLWDSMGTDSSICRAARVTTASIPKYIKDDESLIRYLVRQMETGPFEQAELQFHIRLPIYVARQLLRYRTASVQEYSMRYSEAIDSMQKTHPGAWRKQAKENRQGSSGFLKSDLDNGGLLSAVEVNFHKAARDVYEKRIAAGVAREQARKDLPLSTYTELVFKIDPRNLLHLLHERMSGDHGAHAQAEIRAYADVIGNEIVAKLFPITWSAFQDYVLNAVTLSALDIEVIRKLQLAASGASGLSGEDIWWAALPDAWRTDRCRERDECRAKLVKLGIMRGLG